jgi:hypothetical protein
MSYSIFAMLMSNVFVENYAFYNCGELFVGKHLVAKCQNLHECYEKMSLNYPKYYKMDNLSKLAIVTCENLFSTSQSLRHLNSYDIGIVFSTADGCLEADEKYWQTTHVQPSPALFVYTLPNIAVGELCIRHGLKGETATFITPRFDSTFQTQYVNSLFAAGKVKACVSGWGNFYGTSAMAFFYLAVEKTGLFEHQPEYIEKLVKEKWKN